MKEVYNYIKDTILYSDTRPAVLLTIISAFFWGIIFLLPGSVMERPFYYGLRLISPNEILWATIFITFGIFQVLRLVPGKIHKYTLHIEYIVRFLSCSLWTYIFFTAISQFPPPPVASDTLCLALAAWWDFFRYKGICSIQNNEK